MIGIYTISATKYVDITKISIKIQKDADFIEFFISYGRLEFRLDLYAIYILCMHYEL